MFGAVLGGLLGSAGLLYVFVGKKTKVLEARVAAIESGRGGSAIDSIVLGSRVRALEAQITAEVSQQISDSASRTAEQYMSQVYGLTPERIRGIESLARRLGV